MAPHSIWRRASAKGIFGDVSETGPQSQAGTLDAVADSGLRCPACEYNLTGIETDRCPECGAAVDLEQLRRWADGEPGPIPEWDHPSRSLPVRFARTCLMMWLHPTDFARRMPHRIRAESIARFRRIALGVAWLLTVLIAWRIAGQLGYGIFVSIPVLVGGSVVIIVFEGVLASLCEMFIEPKRPQGSSEATALFWLTSVQVYRSFAPLVAALTLVVLVVEEEILLLLPAAACLRWVWCMIAHLAAVARRGGLPGVVVFAMPLALFLGGMTGATAGGLVFLLEQVAATALLR